MSDLAIDRAEVWVVGPETERYAWALEMPEQFMVQHDPPARPRRAASRGSPARRCAPRTRFDRSVGETLRYLLARGHRPDAGSSARRSGIGCASLNTPMVPQAHSLIDIALWDMAGRHAGLPLYQLLGGARDTILSYASTPLLADARGLCRLLSRRGWRRASRRSSSIAGASRRATCRWCEAVHRAFRRSSGLALMLDVEQRYDRDQARSAARRLERARLRLVRGAAARHRPRRLSRELRRQARVPMIPAGNTCARPAVHRARARDAAPGARPRRRHDRGGITPTRKIMALAEAHGMHAASCSAGATR